MVQGASVWPHPVTSHALCCCWGVRQMWTFKTLSCLTNGHQRVGTPSFTIRSACVNIQSWLCSTGYIWISNKLRRHTCLILSSCINKIELPWQRTLGEYKLPRRANQRNWISRKLHSTSCRVLCNKIIPSRRLWIASSGENWQFYWMNLKKKHRLSRDAINDFVSSVYCSTGLCCLIAFSGEEEQAH